MEVTIDSNSGYCFGVEFAIQMAEDEMLDGNTLYCLGDIVHNDMEVKRLHNKGLRIISRDDLSRITNCKVLIRAHGEPPETYQTALNNNIELIDASCPVVLKLQNRVKNAYDAMREKKGQIVIYGQPGHAEVIGLTGQTGGEAIIILKDEDLDKIDFTRSVTLFSQTTKSTKGFYRIKALIEERLHASNHHLQTIEFNANDSICRQVSNREPQLQKFSKEQDVIIFVSSKKSSNGKALYSVCKAENERSYFIANEDEIQTEWFDNAQKVGICGATSTPMWLMKNVSDAIKNIGESCVTS
ncbi:4-hydroxy-3-methylbut-2-enyl diphosphate reductase [Catalinimonas niigatensis]|uniref:4-hydroxy-3-methylbut-2-enyl diphosphate reductase n=1 Tax=Catalinimonas niigatensis TaxID=1397264 RepID=UPI002666D99F|nr:4-hydroxy-3-methylbut-2-enyl diphosphate reductase [Catalinimonas niigatensis]WPP52458.1 4-hydroxy-3-methylbut-2-enyl diphosphate reductase [Catalinimonas niigatensis]